MRRRLARAAHNLADRLHALSHRVAGDPVWRHRDGVDAELLNEARAMARSVAGALQAGALQPAEQTSLGGHLRGFHGMRKSHCPEDCPLAPALARMHERPFSR